MEAFFGKQTFEVAMALVSVATIALLVSHSKGAAQIITSTGNTFNGLLRTVTLQDQWGGTAISGSFGA
jgi:hypothetical protein